VDEDLLKAYLEAVGPVRKMAGVDKNKPTVADLLNLPAPWLKVEKEEISEEELLPVVKEAVNAALAGMGEMRLREGANLAEDLKKRIAFLREKLSFLKQNQDRVAADYAARLRQRIQKVMNDVNFKTDEGRILQEIAIYSEKTDFTEETVRFGSHLDQFEAALASDKPIGRKLDFLLQELNREINTTASKANDIDIVDCVIMVKTELEKIREQVQNIE